MCERLHELNETMIDIRHYQKHGLQYPQTLTLVDMQTHPDFFAEAGLVMAWVSRKFIAQLYIEATEDYPHMKRLSIARVKRNQHGWVDGITWDELQAVKREVGYGDWYAIEIYPRDCDVVNVANFRHLWLFETPLPFGWVKK
jgi:hypothetical protein